MEKLLFLSITRTAILVVLVISFLLDMLVTLFFNKDEPEGNNTTNGSWVVLSKLERTVMSIFVISIFLLLCLFSLKYVLSSSIMSFIGISLMLIAMLIAMLDWLKIICHKEKRNLTEYEIKSLTLIPLLFILLDLNDFFQKLLSKIQLLAENIRDVAIVFVFIFYYFMFVYFFVINLLIVFNRIADLFKNKKIKTISFQLTCKLRPNSFLILAWAKNKK